MDRKEESKIVVILSGGMDSTTMLYDLFEDGDNDIVGVLSFNYGQKHKKELLYAEKTCRKLGLEHQIINLSSIKPFLKSSLTSNSKIPEGNYADENMKQTVVPNRNMIMLSIATAYAISKGARKVFYGAHAGDHTIYPDCRPEFIEAVNRVTMICDWTPIEIIAPYINLNKSDIVSIGQKLHVPYKDTWTCYKGKVLACGKCGSCTERLEAFANNGIKDPIKYEK
jgi:7-cyano-7-deazaguanine synthase